MALQPRISRSGCIQFVMDKTKILCFSTFLSSRKNYFQNHSGESIGNQYDCMVANLKLVPDNVEVACGLLHHSPGEKATLTLLLNENKLHLLLPKLQLLSTTLLGKQ